MDIEVTKRGIRNDLKEIIQDAESALVFFDAGELERAKENIEEIYTNSDFVISELDNVIDEEEKKEEVTETTPPPQSSPPEPTPAPAESP